MKTWKEKKNEKTQLKNLIAYEPNLKIESTGSR